GQPGLALYCLVEDPHAALADRAERVLGLKRHAELAYHDDVQRRPQFLGHLERDRHSAAWQAEHDDTAAAQVTQPPGQPPARVRTVSEQHRAAPPIRMLSRSPRPCKRRNVP